MILKYYYLSTDSIISLFTDKRDHMVITNTLTKGWSFLQAFLSSLSRPKAMPDISPYSEEKIRYFTSGTKYESCIIQNAELTVPPSTLFPFLPLNRIILFKA